MKSGEAPLEPEAAGPPSALRTALDTLKFVVLVALIVYACLLIEARLGFVTSSPASLVP